MPSDLIGYRQRITNVPSIEEVSYSNANAEMLNGLSKTFSRVEDTVSGMQEDINKKAQDRFFMEKKLQSARAINELSNIFQSDPNGLRESSFKYRDELLKDIDDPDTAARLSFDFDMDIESQIQKATYAQQRRVDNDLQVSSLSYLDEINTKLSNSASGIFSQDQKTRDLSVKEITGTLANVGGVIDRLGPDGQYMFSPELRASAPKRMINDMLKTGVIGALSESKDPKELLRQMTSGEFKTDIPAIGNGNPLDYMDQDSRQKTIMLAEKMISDRSAMVMDSYNELQADIKYRAKIDPLSVDVDKEFNTWAERNGSSLTDPDASDIRVKFLSLKESLLDDTNNYMLSLPYLNGQSTFDGSEKSRKAIENGYDFLFKNGRPLPDRAKWLVSTNITMVPKEMADEIDAKLQSALINNDVKAAAELAETYDVISTSAPIMIADFDTKLNEKSQAALMRIRDTARIGGMGPDVFKDVQRIMSLSKEDLEQRKKDIAEQQKETSYYQSASELLDFERWDTFEPDVKLAVTRQAGNDYRKIYETSYLATGDVKFATDKARSLTQGMYGVTSFTKEGFMRMPPEMRYKLPNDDDTTWMKQDLMLAYESLPNFNKDDIEKLQLVVDPRADLKTKSPEYLITISDRNTDRFDSVGYVWKPDIAARQEFIKLRNQGKLDSDRYYIKSGGLNAGYDYRAFLQDYKAGAFKKEISSIPSEIIFDKGIIQQESGGRQFTPVGKTLTSSKGALGIAQIMPETAQEAASLAGLEYSEARLKTDPSYNKALGLAYFNKQVNDFKDPALAIMAYNAGPGKVNEWINEFGDPRTGSVSMDEFIEKVPYKETKNYIKSISKRLVTNAD